MNTRDFDPRKRNSLSLDRRRKASLNHPYHNSATPNMDCYWCKRSVVRLVK